MSKVCPFCHSTLSPANNRKVWLPLLHHLDFLHFDDSFFQKLKTIFQNFKSTIVYFWGYHNLIACKCVNCNSGVGGWRDKISSTNLRFKVDLMRFSIQIRIIKNVLRPNTLRHFHFCWTAARHRLRRPVGQVHRLDVGKTKRLCYNARIPSNSALSPAILIRRNQTF